VDVKHQVPPPPDVVTERVRSAPVELRDRIYRLRALVYDVGAKADAWPLIEEIKWGQPSYRSPHGNESTPVRIGWTDDGDVALLTHCQSTVIPEFRSAFGDRYRFDGNRAVLLGPKDELHDDDLAELIHHALTYRRR